MESNKGPEWVTICVAEKWSMICMAFSKLPKDEYVNLLENPL